MSTETQVPAAVDALLERARSLDDDDRLALAEARGALDETFHVGAWRAAMGIVADRAEEYFRAWIRIGSAFLPERLEELIQMGVDADPSEIERWREIARLTRVGIDDALLCTLALDRIRPPDLRELYAPWKAMLTAAHERASGQAARGATE